METKKQEQIKKFSKISNFQFEEKKENISDKVKLEIKKEAKELLARFAKKLESVKFTEKKEKEELGGMREEGEGLSCDEDFRKRFFANAPQKEGDFILAEKKKW
mgnify:CR=1 FL=1